MAKFTLHWLSGKPEEVEGSDLADACRKAGIGGGALAALNYYEEDGNRVLVAGQAPCGCVCHSEEGMSCEHDLAQAGLSR